MVTEIISVICFTLSLTSRREVISRAAEKVGLIELIHLPEKLHFVELLFTGKSIYDAERSENTIPFFPSVSRSAVIAD
ncbi:MAG: hypothetical protein E6556_08980 [Pantoea sp.]|uniref:Uncharacterized protein n=1 Tax=Pantoea piersonii TaxID=2364647 RepID=A0AAJ5UA17_9GAMM|nr:MULTISPECIES: hypothetical protein [Pantoea]MDU6433040.1 hypothetical protein [Pantoea sp.]RTY57202.1 hypothetical protein EKL29_12125 [Pantoea sp. YU22]WBG91189.1 hypothetical protein N5580_01065 [Pantoea piersonii]WBV21804.1 hypothetical protein PG877_01060 [Pantoea piersonii]